MKKMESALAGLTARRERIASKRSAAEAELLAAERARLALLTESDADDPKAEARAQSRVDTARSSLEGLTAALASLDEQIAGAERALASERDRVEREAAADKMEADAAAAEKAIEGLTGLLAFGKAFAPLRPVSFDAKQVSEMAPVAAAQLQIAARAAINDARAQARSVRNGAAVIPDLRPEPPPPPAPKPAPTEKIFTLREVKWTDPERSGVQAAPAFFDIVVPPDRAARALELQAAVAPDHEKAKELRGTRPYRHPNHERCVALDDAAGEDGERDSGVLRSESPFVVVDRGPPYTRKISVNGVGNEVAPAAPSEASQ
jgi:hypothetical protein